MAYFSLLIGAIIGGILRYSLEVLIPSNGFPTATLLVNLSGSLILGLFYGGAEVLQIKHWHRIGFGTGVLGTFTSFSTFCLDATHLASTDLPLAVLYAFLSMIGGPVLAFLGDGLVVRLRGIPASEEL